MQVASVCAVLHLHLDKFLLARFSGLAAVAPYEIGFRVATAAATLPQQALFAVMPAVAQLDAEGRHDTLRLLYERGDRYLAAAVAVWVAALVGGAEALLTAWIGPGQAQALIVLRGLAIAWAVALVTGIGTSLARGIGRTDLEARFALAVIAVHIGLSLWLVPHWGVTGAVVATIAANVLGSLVFAIGLAHTLGWLTLRSIAATRAWPALAAAAGIGAAWALARVIATGHGLQAWAVAALLAGVAAAVAGGLLLAVRFVRPGELMERRPAAESPVS